MIGMILLASAAMVIFVWAAMSIHMYYEPERLRRAREWNAKHCNQRLEISK